MTELMGQREEDLGTEANATIYPPGEVMVYVENILQLYF